MLDAPRIAENPQQRTPKNSSRDQSNSPAARPHALAPISANIPERLRQVPQWVCWRYELREDKKSGHKWTKIPVNAQTGGNAMSNEPDTWSDFEKAWQRYDANRATLDGVGFVLTDEDMFAGIDLDHVVTNGQITDPKADQIKEQINSYWEISPSGQGLRCFVIANLPPQGRKCGNIECYEDGRFLTMTGHIIGKVRDVEEQQVEVEQFHAAYFSAKQPTTERRDPVPLSLSDADLLNRARQSKNGDKIGALLDGNISGYPSKSEADLALCSLLAFWSGGDATRLDGWFRSSHLCADKWDKRHYSDGRTYGEATVEKAISGCVNFYDPNRKKRQQKERQKGDSDSPAECTDPPKDKEQDGYDPPMFAVENGQIMHYDEKHGCYVRVCNFVAKITEDVIEDDEAEQRREYVIEAQIKGDTRQRRGTVKAEEFPKMQWVDRVIGAGAFCYPRKGEHLRAAVKALSQERKETRIIAHTGWRDDGDGPLFYHAGGAIGASGLIPHAVKLDGGLEMYNLPEPARGDKLKQAWQTFEQLRASDRSEITAPLLGAILTPAIDAPDCSAFAIGETGHGKTTYVLLFLSLLGVEFTNGKAPAEWEGSTLFGLQVKAHKAKNIPLLIDEYVPRLSRDASKLQHTVVSVLRSQGNRSARTAGRADGGLRIERYPRGLILATGEDLPPGASVRARIIIVEFPDKLTEERKKKLTPLQQSAREGVFAGLFSAYLSWLATDNKIGTKLARRAETIQTLRETWATRLINARVHPRTSSNFASLERAWRSFYHFAVEAGLISVIERNAAMEQIIKGLTTCAMNQAQWQASSDPVKRFINLVGVALASGRAHLIPRDDYGKQWTIEEREAVGWRNDRDERRPQGEAIGFIDDARIYLMPAAARRVVDTYSSNGEGIALTERQLNTQLKTASVIEPDVTRHTATMRRSLNGSTKEVLVFKKATILRAQGNEDDSTEESASDQEAEF